MAAEPARSWKTMASTATQRPHIGIFLINYNAVRKLVSTIERIPEDVYSRVDQIFLIDDCSNDNSYYAALGYQHSHNIEKLKVFQNDSNKGYGGNQKVGYNYAIEQDFDFVVLLHSDGQYAPEILSNLLAPLENDEADVVFGSRMMKPFDALKGGMPPYKFIGNIILTTMQNWCTGAGLSEFHSGYRVYSVAALKQIPFNSFSNGFDFDTQIILSLLERKFRICERPIPTYYGDEICHVNGIPYAIRCMKHCFEYYRKHKRGEMMFPAEESA